MIKIIVRIFRLFLIIHAPWLRIYFFFWSSVMFQINAVILKTRLEKSDHQNKFLIQWSLEEKQGYQQNFEHRFWCYGTVQQLSTKQHTTQHDAEMVWYQRSFSKIWEVLPAMLSGIMLTPGHFCQKRHTFLRIFLKIEVHFSK